jgi:sugar phosphate permease
MCMGFINTKAELIALRLLLGACEAGYFPGITFYLTFFYRRRELGFRIFLLFTASAVAGSCGGLLAYGIGHMDGVRGWSAWRWLMILEGIPTILLGIAAYIALSNDPNSSSWLTPREKELTQLRRELDRTPLDDGNKIQWDQVMEGFKDWKIWVLSLGQLGVTVMLYGYSTFLPTIIAALGYSAIHTQLLTIPCYACGAIVYCISAYYSDKVGQRGIFAIVACLVSCTGYAILLGTWNYGAGAQYAGCLVVAVGLYVAVGIPITWMPNNLATHYKRATGQGMLFMLSNFAGVISSYLYPTRDGPEYTMGHAVMLGFVLYSATTYAFISVMLRRENMKRERGERDHVLVGKTQEEILTLGDRHPAYRYIY